MKIPGTIENQKYYCYKCKWIISYWWNYFSFSEHLQLMFEEHPPWDMKKKYTAHNIHMYYENTESGKLYPVELHKPLKEILSQETYVFILHHIANINILFFFFNIYLANIYYIYFSHLDSNVSVLILILMLKIGSC